MVKSKTKKGSDPEFAYEMIMRRMRQNERISDVRYVPRSKYQPNKLPLYSKETRRIMKATDNG